MYFELVITFLCLDEGQASLPQAFFYNIGREAYFWYTNVSFSLFPLGFNFYPVVPEKSKLIFKVDINPFTLLAIWQLTKLTGRLKH